MNKGNSQKFSLSCTHNHHVTHSSFQRQRCFVSAKWILIYRIWLSISIPKMHQNICTFLCSLLYLHAYPLIGLQFAKRVSFFFGPTLCELCINASCFHEKQWKMKHGCFAYYFAGGQIDCCWPGPCVVCRPTTTVHSRKNWMCGNFLTSSRENWLLLADMDYMPFFVWVTISYLCGGPADELLFIITKMHALFYFAKWRLHAILFWETHYH